MPEARESVVLNSPLMANSPVDGSHSAEAAKLDVQRMNCAPAEKSINWPISLCETRLLFQLSAQPVNVSSINFLSIGSKRFTPLFSNSRSLICFFNLETDIPVILPFSLFRILSASDCLNFTLCLTPAPKLSTYPFFAKA